MNLPSFPTGFPAIPSTQVRIIEELTQLNHYMEILIEVFIRAFPQVKYEALEEELKAAKKRRDAIGFRSSDADDQGASG
jgi:hypothetical protein